MATEAKNNTEKKGVRIRISLHLLLTVGRVREFKSGYGGRDAANGDTAIRRVDNQAWHGKRYFLKQDD
jgi:hypothetical protein